MRVSGTRADGALWLSLDGGMSVILRGDTCSPPVDHTEAEAMGPWTDAHGVSGLDRRELRRRLDRAATRPLTSFTLDRKVKVTATHGKKKMKFEYAVTGEEEKVIGDEPGADEVDPEAKTDDDAQTDEAAAKAKSEA